MARRKRKKSFGAYHKPEAAHRAFTRGRKGKNLSIVVNVRRNITYNGAAGFIAHACVRNRGRTKGGAAVFGKASHCGELSGGHSPTMAAARAVETLARDLKAKAKKWER